MELLMDPTVWVSFASLTVMEIVLGIDNIVFISVLVAGLPKQAADRARQIGLLLALVFRIILLFLIAWVIGLTQPLFTLFEHDFSWRDIILLAGGLFLIYKATHEIHGEMEDPGLTKPKNMADAAFTAVVTQIVIIDAVFSIDSIITAIGMAQHVEVMIAAVIVAMGVMYAASGPIADFVHAHPTTKMLALAFLILIGVTLVADGLGFHVPKGYIYSAMAFSVLVETFNIIVSSRRKAHKKAQGE